MKKTGIAIGILILAAGAFLLLPQGAAHYAITNAPQPGDNIIAFGDSLVFGEGSTDGHDFVSDLSRKIGKPIDNEGIPGNTTADGLARLGRDVLSKHPDIVLVLLGGNDYLHRVPAEQTFANLKEIITRIQHTGAAVVLLGVRGGVIADHFRGPFDNLARQTGSAYVYDVLDGLFEHPAYMFDEVHPNDKGYAVIAERVYPAIEQVLS